MRALATHVPQAPVQPTPLAAWSPYRSRSTQLAPCGHSIATTQRQNVVAADAVIKELVLGPPAELSEQATCHFSTQQDIPELDSPGSGSRTALCRAQAPAFACAPAQASQPVQQGQEWHIVQRTRKQPQLQQPLVPLQPCETEQLHTASGDQSALHLTTVDSQAQHQQQPDFPALEHDQQQLHRTESAAALDYQKSICRSLRAENCSTVEQLAAVISEHGSYMDPQAVAASFTAAARIGRQLQQQELRAAPGSRQQGLYQLAELLERQLLPLLQPKLRQLDAVGLQMVLYSLAALQYKHEVLVLQLEVAVTPLVHHLPPGRLCQLAWSLGQLGFSPNGQLVKTVLRCSGRCMSFLQGQDLCQLLQGLVLLQLQPHALWLDAVCARVLQLCAHNQLQTRTLCSVVHNLARLVSSHQQQQGHDQDQQGQQQDVPRTASGMPQPLLQSLLSATQQVLEQAAEAGAQQQGVELQPQQHQQPDCKCAHQQRHRQAHRAAALAGTSHAGNAQSGWHMLRMQLPAAGELHVPCLQQQQLQQQCQLAELPQTESATGSNSHMRLRKRDQQQRSQDAGLTLAGLVTLADALRRLKVDPPGDWQAAYMAAAEQLMHSSDARNLPLLLAPCVRWQQAPGQAWLQQYLALCQGQLPHMHRQGLAVLGHSLTALQVQLSEAWLSAYLTAADSCRLAATPAGCSYLMHTLGVWRQLGLVAAPQQAPGAAAAGAADSAHAGVSAAYAVDAAGVGRVQFEGVVAAAVGEQLQSQAQVLARQCCRCFMDHGRSFTAEQLGMFCKGLAYWGMRGTPELSHKLEQVLLQHLSKQPSNRWHRAVSKQRPTATTLCGVLLALAVACPEAATASLLSVLWTTWSAWLLPLTTTSQAAGAAWAVGRLGVQPPQEFAQGLLQQLRAAAAEAQLQHLAAVLLEAKQGGWQVQPLQVQGLVQAMLRKQAGELQDAAQHRPAYGQTEQQQEQPHALAHVARSAQGCSCGGSGNSGDSSGSSKQVDLDRGSSEADGRLYGLANHRLKGWVTAAAASAAWCDVMSVLQLQLAVDLYSSVLEWLPAEQQGAVEAHLNALKARYWASGGSSNDSRGRFMGTTGNQGFDSGMGSKEGVDASRQQSAPRLAS